MSSISTVKSAIGVNLAALVTSEVIAGYTVSDFKKNPLAADIPSFPHAFLVPPSMESTVLDNRSVLRTYVFDILVVVNAENITTTDYLENLIEGIINKFDNDPTLQGTANGGVLPISSSPAPYQHGGKDLVMVVIAIEAKTDVSLTFS